jgi:hypothetical protein
MVESKMCYEAYREFVFDRQKTMGSHSSTRPVADQPYADLTSEDGKPWPEFDTVRLWDSLVVLLGTTWV